MSTTTILVSEIIGTMFLILLGDGVVGGVLLSKTKGQNSGWIVITWAWGMAVFVGVFTSVALGGQAHLNPAVTIAFAMRGICTWAQAPIFIIGEFIGAFIGAFLVWLHYFPHWEVTEDKGLKLAVFCTAPAIRNTAWNLVSEIIGTFALVYGVLAVISPGAPASVITGAFSVGLIVLVIGLGLGGTTGYAINPARDLGPRIMHAILPIAGKGGSDWGYSWIPVVGPIIGGIIAALVFGMLPMP